VDQKPVITGIFSGPDGEEEIFNVKLLLRARNVKKRIIKKWNKKM
jgi:hypothetical protein